MQQEEKLHNQVMQQELPRSSEQKEQIPEQNQINDNQSSHLSNVAQQPQSNYNFSKSEQKNNIQLKYCNNNKLMEEASPDVDENPSKVRRRGRRKNVRIKKAQGEDRTEDGQICELFIELIDVINRCYTGISLPRDPPVLLEEGHKIKQHEQQKNHKRETYTSVRLKRKPTQKYNQPDKQVQRIKQHKAKRQNIRKSAPILAIVGSTDQVPKIDKDPQANVLSVQQILNRKLQEQKEAEKRHILSSYEQIMRYEIIEEEPVMECMEDDRVGIEGSEKQRMEREKSESLRKLSIEKCLQMSVTPSKEKTI